MSRTVIDRIGEKYTSNDNEDLIIIDYRNAYQVDIQFYDGTILKNLQFTNIKLGKIKNPNRLSILNIGYFGIGKYNAKDYKIIYQSWHHMMYRCYDEKTQLKSSSYIGCAVDKRWHNFQSFAEWYENNYIDGWELDKDILFKGNKVYGPDTCCFVPKQINSLFTKADKIRGNYPIGVHKTISGNYTSAVRKFNKTINLGIFNNPEEAFHSYKINKESYIQQIANIWKNELPDITYKSLINYKVEITD